MRGVEVSYERTQAATSKDLQKTRLALDKARLALETSKVQVKKFIDKYSHSRDVIAARLYYSRHEVFFFWCVSDETNLTKYENPRGQPRCHGSKVKTS